MYEPLISNNTAAMFYEALVVYSFYIDGYIT